MAPRSGGGESFETGARPAPGDWLEASHHGWAFSHFPEVVPTVTVDPGSASPRALVARPAGSLSGVEIVAPGVAPVTPSEFFERTSTDAVVVLRGGDIVHEQYAGHAGPEQRHVLMSVSKSIGAMVAGRLIEDDILDRRATVERYVPELASSAYGTATVSQLLDMTASLCFSQDYDDPASEVQQQDRAAGWRVHRRGDPPDLRAFLTTLRPLGPHGVTFQYCSATTDVLSWVIERAATMPYAELLSKLVWSRIGAEHSAVISVDSEGVPYACAGMAATARDLARFGVSVLREGGDPGAEAMPREFIADMRRGGQRSAIAAHDFVATHPNGSYRDQWWVTGDARGSFLAIGIFGQYLWLDPSRDVVIVKLSSQAGPLEDRGLHDAAFATIAAQFPIQH